jgi:hypothetical protein
MEGDIISDRLESLALFGAAAFMYLLPAFVAWKRSHKNLNAIGVLNFFLGWTMLGWFGSMAWAFTSNTAHNSKGDQ